MLFLLISLWDWWGLEVDGGTIFRGDYVRFCVIWRLILNEVGRKNIRYHKCYCNWRY